MKKLHDIEKYQYVLKGAKPLKKNPLCPKSNGNIKLGARKKVHFARGLS